MSTMPMPSSPMPVSLGAPEGPPIAVPPPPLSVAVGGLGFAVVALFLLGLATFLYFEYPDSRGDGVPLWGGLGVLALVGSIVAFVRRARLRFRAQLFQQGFTIDDAAFRFDELEAIALDEKPRLSNGKAVGFDRRLAVRAPSGRAEVRHFVGRIDPLGSFTSAVLDRAAEAGERRLARGINGAGWRIDAGGLRVGRTGVTPFAEITKAGIFDGQIRLWRRRDEAPFLSIATGSDNAFTLLRLLEPRLEARAAAAPAGTPDVRLAPSAPGEEVHRPAPTAGEVGRLLFERRPKRLLGFLTGIFALFTPAIPFLWMDVKSDDDLLAAVFVTIAAPLSLLATLSIFTSVVRFYEHAVTKRSLFGSRTHRYAAVERMKWTETRMYVNGGYAGTATVARLHSTGQKKPLKFSFQRSGSDEDLGYVRDTISYFIALLMERQIAAYGRVPWGGATVSLTKDALEVKRGRNVEQVPFTMPLRATMQRGVLQFFRPGEKKALASLSAGSENFFPGLLVLQKNARLVD